MKAKRWRARIALSFVDELLAAHLSHIPDGLLECADKAGGISSVAHHVRAAPRLSDPVADCVALPIHRTEATDDERLR